MGTSSTNTRRATTKGNPKPLWLLVPPNAVRLSQLKRWAKQTADQIAGERGIPANQIEYDPDLEAQLEQCETV